MALEEIKSLCKSIRENQCFFNFDFHQEKVVQIQEFKTIQESQISHTIKYLRINWIAQLTDIITKYFQDIGPGWFNLKETNKLTYDFGKLKRVLLQVRLMMQDTLRKLLQESLGKFLDFFSENAPD